MPAKLEIKLKSLPTGAWDSGERRICYCKYVYIELRTVQHKNTCLQEIFQYNRNNSVASDIFLEVGQSPVFILYTKYLYIKSTTVYVPSLELGLSQPLSRQRVCPSPPEPHLPAGEGLGGESHAIPTTGEKA